MSELDDLKKAQSEERTALLTLINGLKADVERQSLDIAQYSEAHTKLLALEQVVKDFIMWSYDHVDTSELETAIGYIVDESEEE